MNSAISKTINLPSNNGFRKYLYGISNPGHRYEGRYRLDYGRDYNPVSSFEVFYPQQSFTDYRTSMYVIDELYQKEWYQSVYGEIPTNFTKIDVDFNYLSTSYDNFEITTSGDYIKIISAWRSDSYSGYWSISGGKEDKKYALPVFPNSAKQLFNLNRTSFNLCLTDIVDYPELLSNSEVLNIGFNSPDYFYDVVNEFRRYTKYAPDGLLKQGSKKVSSVELLREPFMDY